MRLSRFFLPILRETPKEAEIVSHRLMLRAGMVRQEAAGIYAFLPLGLRVLQKVCRIVREEQDRAGAIEMLMPTSSRPTLREADARTTARRCCDQRSPGARHAVRADQREMTDFPRCVRSYRPAAQFIISNEVPIKVFPRFGTMRSREF
jgi:prolyl-tRNA synthetase